MRSRSVWGIAHGHAKVGNGPPGLLGSVPPRKFTMLSVGRVTVRLVGVSLYLLT